MSDDRKKDLRPPLRVVVLDEAESSRDQGAEHSDALGNFREWDSFRWKEDPAGYVIWARRVRKAIEDYMHGEEPMPEPYWFLRGFMDRWRRIHRGFVARFIERRAHYEYAVRGNKELAYQLMLYSKAIDLGRDLDPTGAFTDGLEDTVGLCPQCGNAVDAHQLVAFEPPQPTAYLQHLHSIYRCNACGWRGMAKNLINPNKAGAPEL